MIYTKFKVQDKWEYREFNSNEELNKFIKENEGKFSEYEIKPDDKKRNFFQNWWYNISHTKSNLKKVRGSPYASLQLAYKARLIIVGLLIPYLAWMTFKLVKNYHATGYMNIVGRVISIVIMAYIMYKVWKTIPQAKKQMEYYRKYPHTINYCPTDTKETVDEIFAKIKQNKENRDKEVKKQNDVQKKEDK